MMLSPPKLLIIYVLVVVSTLAITGMAQLPDRSVHTQYICAELFQDRSPNVELSDFALDELAQFRTTTIGAAPIMSVAVLNSQYNIIAGMLASGISSHVITRTLAETRPPVQPIGGLPLATLIDQREADIRPWIPHRKISLNFGSIKGASFSPDGKNILIFSDEELLLYDWDGTVVGQYHDSEIRIRSAMFFADNSGVYLIADVAAQKIVEVFDLALRRIDEYYVQPYMGNVLSLHPNLNDQLARNWGPRWNPRMNKYVDENIHILSNRSRENVASRIYGEIVDAIRNPNISSHLFGDPNYRMVTYVSGSNSIHLYDSKGSNQRTFLKVADKNPPKISTVAIAPDNRRIVAVDSKNNLLLYWDNVLQPQRIPIHSQMELQDVLFTPGGFLAIVLGTPYNTSQGDNWNIFLFNENGIVGDKPIYNSRTRSFSKFLNSDVQQILVMPWGERSSIINLQGRREVVLDVSNRYTTSPPPVSVDGSRLLTVSVKSAQIWMRNPTLETNKDKQ